MKFNFKIQKYQTEAVEAVVSVFAAGDCEDNGKMPKRNKNL